MSAKLPSADRVRGRCVVIATGGTIASRIDAKTGLAMPAWSGKELVAAVPLLASLAQVEVQSVVQVASPYITPGHWALIHSAVSAALARDDVDGVVVTHGTGLLEETAWFLDLTLAGEKPVVVTGAQRNASIVDTDGPRNLCDAAAVALSGESRGLGVLVAFGGYIDAARDVRKSHSLDMAPFDSGDRGHLGSVAGNAVRYHCFPRAHARADFNPGLRWPEVEIVSMYAGATGRLVRDAAEFADGIVVEAVGTGHVNAEMYSALREAMKKGVIVVVASRIPSGGTLAHYGFEGSSQSLVDAGAILASDLSAWKARVALMVGLAAGYDANEIAALVA